MTASPPTVSLTGPWHLTAATGGPAATNGYVLADPHTGAAALIDAPYQATGELLDAIAAHGWRLEWLWLTHGHWDHIGEHQAVTAATGARLAISPDDEFFLRDGQPPGMGWSLAIPRRRADVYLRDGDVLTLGRLRVQVMATPGHSPGGVCLLVSGPLAGPPPAQADSPELLLAGDTLFAGSIGRLDLPGANPTAMVHSLQRLMTLADATPVWPGHGPATTIGHERATNPFVRQALAVGHFDDHFED